MLDLRGKKEREGGRERERRAGKTLKGGRGGENQLPSWICLSLHVDGALDFFLKGLVLRSPHLRCVPFKMCVRTGKGGETKSNFCLTGNQRELKNWRESVTLMGDF